jgi:diadenosine tetraphosphate (Ap4A) HIT family hydrolase
MQVDEQDPYAEWVIRRYPSWTLYLSPQQYYLGRCYVWLKRFGKMQRITDLKYNEWIELYDSILPEYERAVDGLWKPGHMNYAWLGNEFIQHNGHGHMHVIPRYDRPIHFAGREFRDDQWGGNYAPYPRLALPKETLILIRDALRNEIH